MHSQLRMLQGHRRCTTSSSIFRKVLGGIPPKVYGWYLHNPLGWRAPKENSGDSGCYLEEMKVAFEKITEMERAAPDKEEVTSLDAGGRSLVETNLGYHFRNSSFLDSAFIHTSTGTSVFPRLANLGDAVLHLATTEVLLRKYPFSDPGLLSIARSRTESRIACAKFARALHLDSYLVVGRSYAMQNLPPSEGMIAELYEAVLGAVFMDGGYQPVKDIVAATLKDCPADIESLGQSIVT